MDMPVPSSGRALSVPELDQRLKDYGLLEASMTIEEKIELFDTLEQSKLSAQHQPRKPEKDIEDVSILPSSPFLRRLSSGLNVSASSAAASPLIRPGPERRRPLRTRRTSPGNSQLSQSSTGTASQGAVSGGGAPRRSPSKAVGLSQSDSHQLQTPPRPRVPSPSMYSADDSPAALAAWNSCSPTSSLVALSRSPSPRGTDQEEISPFSTHKSVQKKSRENGDRAGVSPVASPVENSGFGGARDVKVPLRSPPKDTHQSDSDLYPIETAVKAPVPVRKLNVRRISSSSEESLQQDGAIPAPVADGSERSEDEAEQEVIGHDSALWYVNQDGAKVVAKRAAHVTAVLAGRQSEGSDAELLRVWERLVELEAQYCERHADEQKGQRQPPWPDEMAPTRGFDEAALPPPGALPYSHLRVDPELLRKRIADSENNVPSVAPVQNKRVDNSKPASSQKEGGAAPRKFFRGKPALIPVVKCTSNVRQLSSDEEAGDALPSSTKPAGVYDAVVSEAGDAPSPEPTAADASRAHARSSRLLMQSLSTQKQKSTAHKLSLKLRQRPDLPVPTAPPAPSSAGPADRADATRRGAEANRSRPRRAPPPALPTLPSLAAGGDVPRRRRMSLAPDDDSSDSSGAAAEKRRRLGLSTETSAEVIRPAALKFPRTGGQQRPPRKNLVPVITLTQARNSSKNPVATSSTRSSSDDDDVEMVCESPRTSSLASTAEARAAPIASTSRRTTPPARLHGSGSTPGPPATANISSRGSGWLSSLTPSTSAAARKPVRSSSGAGGRPSGSGLSKGSRISRTPASSLAATRNTIESDSTPSSGASSAGDVTPPAAGSRPVAGPSSAPNRAPAATPAQPAVDAQIECPICSNFFPRDQIEVHASQCEGDVMEIRDSPSPPPVTRGATLRTARAGTPPGFQRCRLCGTLQTEGQEYLVHVDECVRGRRDGKEECSGQSSARADMMAQFRDAARLARPSSSSRANDAASLSRVGVSPSSAFQRIRVQTDSSIDYHNQFRVAEGATPRRRRRGGPRRGRRTGRGKNRYGTRGRGKQK